MVSVEYSEALVEVLQVLENTNENLVNKIPKKFTEFMKNNASKIYQVELNKNQPLNELPLKEKTKDILAMIYRTYWCTPQKRSDYDKILEENERKYQAELREKYNPGNIFKNNNDEEKLENEEVQIVEYKDRSIFKNFVEKLKGFFQQILNKKNK